jgi:Tfp pilus assembly protein PilN
VRTTPLNLATRPVRNERLPALLFLLAAFALLIVTAQHAVIVYRLRPGGSKALHAEVERLRDESANLTKEAGELRRVTVSSKDLLEWNVLKGLVDRRTFWWSKLFEVLEQMMPADVRIVSITPRVRDQERLIDFIVHVQQDEAAYRFEQALRKRPEFADVVLKGMSREAQGGEVEFPISARYLAGEPTEASPPVPPPPSGGGTARLARQEETP